MHLGGMTTVACSFLILNYVRCCLITQTTTVFLLFQSAWQTEVQTHQTRVCVI